MSSVALGIGTAFSWAAATLLLAGAARDLAPLRFALLFVGYQVLIIMPFGIAAAATQSWDASQLGGVAVAGVLQAGGLVAYGQALKLSPVAVASALTSLEGVVAASLAIAGGEQFGALTAIGLALASCGGLLLGGAAPDRAGLRGIGLALLTAVAFGTGFWLIDEAGLPNALTLLVFNAVAALTLGAVYAARSPRARRARVATSWPLIGAAALNLVGYLLFTLGAELGSLAITAVLASQFAVLTAIASYFLRGESLSRNQIISMALLAAGVAGVTLGTA